MPKISSFLIIITNISSFAKVMPNILILANIMPIIFDFSELCQTFPLLFHFYQSFLIFASLCQSILFCPTCYYPCNQNNIIYLLSKIVKNNKIPTSQEIIEFTHLLYLFHVPVFDPFYSSLPDSTRV